MSDLFWLSDAQMARLERFFPKSHGKPRVDGRRVLSGIIFINRNGLRWRDAPKDYADGLSPKKIAESLNAEGIAPPSGRYWGTSTIHGNRQRGTGILNNELYIGRQIWNRLNYRKAPSTGKRISRLNPESAWVITEVPALWIIEQELWDRVRTRQGALTLQSPLDKLWDRRRPRTLFSGLMTCGCCGGGIAKVSKSSFGCSSARNKGEAVCINMRTIAQTDLEARVLNALTNHLMDPEALAVLCETYADERNRLRREAKGARETLERGLAQTKRDHQKLVDAIIAGVPAEQVKERMIELDQQRQQLERRLSASPAPDPILIHPSMAVTYRERVGGIDCGSGEKRRDARCEGSAAGFGGSGRTDPGEGAHGR
ncbi:recombinase [Ruegeria sp. TrichCH4B]|nr:recombinase [Ruegeria sp. TrichCH4B]